MDNKKKSLFGHEKSKMLKDLFAEEEVKYSWEGEGENFDRHSIDVNNHTPYDRDDNYKHKCKKSDNCKVLSCKENACVYSPIISEEEYTQLKKKSTDNLSKLSKSKIISADRITVIYNILARRILNITKNVKLKVHI